MTIKCYLNGMDTSMKKVYSVSNKLVENYSPEAVGIFESGAVSISPSSDVDLYVLSDHEERQVLRESGLVFETYFSRPK